MPTRAKAHELSDNGLLLENGVWLTSGSATPTHTANLGDFYFKTDGTRWRQTGNPTGSTWQQIPFSVLHGTWSDSGAPNPGISTPSTSYEVVANLIFPGTANFGTIKKITILAMNEDVSTDSLQVKIFDKTNSLTIAEKTGIVGTTNFVFKTFDMGTISNQPSAQATFEIQIRKQGPGNPMDSWISAILAEF